MNNLDLNFINNKAKPYVKLHNTANELPYHNLKHTLIVFDMCMNYIQNNDDIQYPNELLISALFHDFNHTGMQPDNQNIENAIDGITEFHSQYETFFDLEICKQLINSTLFDKNIKKSFNLQEEKVINDADMGMFFLENEKEQELSQIGLSKEFGMSMKDFLKNQMDFINNLEFNTEYFKNIWNHSIKEIAIQNQTLINNRYF